MRIAFINLVFQQYRCRVSGVRKIQKLAHRKQPATSPSAVSSGPNGSAESMTAEKRQTVFCPQSSVYWHPTP